MCRLDTVPNRLRVGVILNRSDVEKEIVYATGKHLTDQTREHVKLHICRALRLNGIEHGPSTNQNAGEGQVPGGSSGFSMNATTRPVWFVAQQARLFDQLGLQGRKPASQERANGFHMRIHVDQNLGNPMFLQQLEPYLKKRFSFDGARHSG